MKIGMSLSFCVADIARGLVNQDDVAGIIASTRSEDMEDVIEHYQKLYWENLPNAANIARNLFAEGKVYQPRLWGQESFNITDGHWAEVTKL